MGEWRLEIVFLMEDEGSDEEDHALTIAERCNDVVKGASLDMLTSMLTKEF